MKIITLNLVVMMMSAGCWPLEYANEEFKQVIPLEDELLVKIGSQDGESTGATAILDPYAKDGCDDCCIEEIDGEEWYVDGEIYKMTREAKWHVNGGLVVSMGWIWAIVNSPVGDETDLGYLWGPWQESLSRIEFRFAMDKTASGQFEYRLEGRNINEVEDVWVPLVYGEIFSTGKAHASTGGMTIDYSAIKSIDSAHPTPASGKIIYDFDVREYPFTVKAEFKLFEYAPDAFLSAIYQYKRYDEGMAGELSFDIEADVWPEGAPDGEIETIKVESKWTAIGEGRGDASVSGGSLDLSDSIVDTVSLLECWADSTGLFYATYEKSSIEYNDGTGVIEEKGCGEVAHCPVF